MRKNYVGLFTILHLSLCVLSVPTVYRMKDNRVLEPDLVPVSSTVIPLDVYRLGAGLNVTNPYKRHKVVTNIQGTKALNGQTYKKFYYGNRNEEKQ